MSKYITSKWLCQQDWGGGLGCWLYQLGIKTPSGATLGTDMHLIDYFSKRAEILNSKPVTKYSPRPQQCICILDHTPLRYSWGISWQEDSLLPSAYPQPTSKSDGEKPRDGYCEKGWYHRASLRPKSMKPHSEVQV